MQYGYMYSFKRDLLQCQKRPTTCVRMSRMDTCTCNMDSYVRNNQYNNDQTYSIQ